MQPIPELLDKQIKNQVQREVIEGFRDQGLLEPGDSADAANYISAMRRTADYLEQDLLNGADDEWHQKDLRLMLAYAMRDWEGYITIRKFMTHEGYNDFRHEVQWQLSGDYNMEKSFIETEGDLQELMKMMDKLEDRHEVRLMCKFIMSCEGIVSRKSMEEIPEVKEFKHHMPKLYNTFCIWAWG